MKIMSRATIIVGLNGALQKRFILSPKVSLVPGDVHRAERLQIGLGGKGQDVAVALDCLEYQGSVQLAQFTGKGAEGDVVYGMLQDMLGEDGMQLTVRPNSIMRTCTSIVAEDSTTELVEPSETIQKEEIQELFDMLRGKTADALCIMGSMPPGCPDDMYANIYSIVADKKTLCLIDTVVGLPELLSAIARKTDKGPVMLKCNASELCRVAQVTKKASESGGIAIDELLSAIHSFLQKYDYQALSAIAITDGPHDAYFIGLPVGSDDEFRLFRVPVAQLQSDDEMEFSNGGSSRPLYPIGAGDAVAAGTLAAWKCLMDVADSKGPCLPQDIQSVLAGNERPSTRAMMTAFSFGLACGAASCLEEENSVLKIPNVLELFGKEGRPIFVSSHKITPSKISS